MFRTNSAPVIRPLTMLAICIILSMGGTALAQEPSTTSPSGESNQSPPDPEELQKRIESLELEKKLYEAQLEAIKAKWAISETKGKEGSITIEDDAGYFAEILAYSTLEGAATEIAEKTKEKLHTNDELIILGNVDLAQEKLLWDLLHLKLDLAIHKMQRAIEIYPNLVETEPENIRGVTEPLVAVPAILGAIADIVAFFKSDYALYGRKISLNEKALIAATANQISTQKPKVEILIPEYNVLSADSLGEKIKTLSTLISTLESKKPKIEQLLLKKSTDSSELKKRKEVIITPLDKEIDAARKLVTTLISYSDSTASPLEKTANIDFIHLHPDAKILHLTIVSQGAEIETTETSLSRGRISYMAGVVVTYFLTNAEGRYFQSGNAYKMKTKSFKPKNDPKNELILFDPPKPETNSCTSTQK